MKEEVQDIKDKHTFESGGETVCQVCGVRCNPDEPADYQAHLDGRLHEGYIKIRAKVKELREKLRTKPHPDEKAGDRDKDRDRERRRDAAGRDAAAGGGGGGKVKDRGG